MLAMLESLFLRACRRQPVERTPIWMMRQAGRYLPAYRAVRARASFLDLCRNPDLSCEVTLQPIDEFGFDAAILFSDILITLPAMGLEVAFPDTGPKIATPVRSDAAIAALHVPDPEAELPYVMAAVRQIKGALAGRVPLIGFAGAPLTMLTYAVEGGGSKDYAHTKKLLYGAPASAHALLDKLARTCASYLEAQVAAGADTLQIFDSWGGIVSPGDFREYPLRYARQVIELLRASPTWAHSVFGPASKHRAKLRALVPAAEVDDVIDPHRRARRARVGCRGLIFCAAYSPTTCSAACAAVAAVSWRSSPIPPLHARCSPHSGSPPSRRRSRPLVTPDRALVGRSFVAATDGDPVRRGLVRPGSGPT
jgi:uroporphyrinogen decarboxylase